MPRLKEMRAHKSALLAFARHKVGVPVFMLFLVPLLLTGFAAVLFQSVSPHTAFAWPASRAAVEPASGRGPAVSRAARDGAQSAAARARARLRARAQAATPACARRGRARSFIVLFMGHSGSTALISALQQHREVAVRDYEPLDHGALGEDTAGALRYADAYFARAHAQGKVGGFKMRPRHILKQPDDWAALFRRHDTRIIWNFRSNVFKQAVGHYPIRFLNDSTRYEGIPVAGAGNGNGTRRGVARFRIHDMGALHELLQERIRGETHVELACVRAGEGRCMMPVAYERLLRDARLEVLRMQAFLGIGMEEGLRPRRRKATKDNLCEVVSNWDEVCEAFYGCQRWRAMMEDLDNGCTCKEVRGGMDARWHRYCFRGSAERAYHFSGIKFEEGKS